MSAAPADDTALVSVVAPVYNEIETLPEFHRRVSEALSGRRYELVLVDDGSTDGTGMLLQQIAARDPAVRPVHLSRNFGHQAALTAGLEAARGAAAVTIDADLQDPPEVIIRLLEQWEAGADVVHGVRHERRGESRRRLFVIRAFYRVFDRLSGLSNFPGHSGDFRLISRPALDALNALPERNRFVRGLISWVGFRQVSVVYERDARFAGSSKYPLRKLLSLAANGILSFSALPLRAAAWLGLVMSITAFAAIPVVVILKLAGLYDVSGIASVHILVLLVGGIQLLFLGVIGEYLARDYDETKRRPVYILGEAPPAELMEEEFYPAYYRLEGRHWWFLGRRSLFLRVLEQQFPPPTRPIELLDFGCGTGAFLEHLERFGTVSAVDADPSAVAFCHSRGRGEVQLAPPGAPLPFVDGAFDLVTTLDVIEHIEDDVGALRELHRVLRPGGRLLVAVPAFMFLWGKQDEVSHHHRRYTARTLRRALAEAGFAVERTTYFNTILFPPIAAVRLARRLLRRPSTRQSDFDVGPAALNRALGALFGAEARVIARWNVPFGVSLLALARRP